MPSVIAKPATYADLEAVPPHLVAEILFGRLVTHPRPTPRHGGAASVLTMVLGGPFHLGKGGPGGWFFVVEPELHLGPNVAVPDIAGWRRERLGGPVDKAYFEVAPDWVCEVLSPRTEKYDKGDKRQIYADFSVEHLWYVDPRVRMLEVFARRERNWLLTGVFFENDAVGAAPFEAASFDLGLLWPFDAPDAPAS